MELAENKSREDMLTGNYTLANDNKHVEGKIEFIDFKSRWFRIQTTTRPAMTRIIVRWESERIFYNNNPGRISPDCWKKLDPRTSWISSNDLDCFFSHYE